uniref:DEX1 C-terminal domain-containing protein n=1 Tax=Entomoneis paludosa TaxID=265537 RepID=A0A7S2Y4Q3_9STRA
MVNTMGNHSPMRLWLLLVTLLATVSTTQANSQSTPYIAFRTSPLDEERTLDLPPDTTRSTLRQSRLDNDQCPLSFSLGISKRWHENLDGPAINQPPVLRTVYPAAGPGKQVVYLTQYEHLDLLSPALYDNRPRSSGGGSPAQEALLQAPEFPLLWESSSFHSSPILHDVNGDGIMDAIVADYDGGISIMGLAFDQTLTAAGGDSQQRSRYFRHAQVPRLHVRRDWVTSRVEKEAGTFNETDTRDPYHSYFEYSYGNHNEGHDVLRGVSANVLDQDQSTATALQERRAQRVSHETDAKDHVLEEEENNQEPDMTGMELGGVSSGVDETQKEDERETAKVDAEEEPVEHRRRLQEVEPEPPQVDVNADFVPKDEITDPQLNLIPEEVGVNKAQVKNPNDTEVVKPVESAITSTQEQAGDAAAVAEKQEEPKSGANPDTPAKVLELELDSQQEELRRQLEQKHDAQEPPKVEEQAKSADELEQAQQKQEEIRQILEQKHEESNPQSDISSNSQSVNENGAADALRQALEQKHEDVQAAEGDTKTTDPVNEELQQQQNDIRQQLEQKHEEAAGNAMNGEETMDDNKKEEREPYRGGDAPTEDDMFQADDDIDMPFPADDDYSTDRDLEDEAEQLKKDLGDEHDMEDYTDDMYYGRDGMADDEYRRYADYDDYYGGGGGDYEHDDFYDDKHYIRVPPHILSTPVLVEIPKLYGDQDMEDFLMVTATYFFDEDEYEGKFSYKRFTVSDHGDENEVKRGQYVSSAILAYTFDGMGRWSAQTHLDLSTDFTAPENATLVGAIPIRSDVSEMGAFALSSPTVADVDGDGSLDVLVGTSMGFLYMFDARNLYKRENWPIQLKAPIESQPLVEDVVGDTNLEIFVMDVTGNVVCLTHDAKVLWNRDILKSLGFGNAIAGMSPMTLGDVNGDGSLDLVLTVKVDGRWVIFAFDASSGRDVKNFPLELDQVNDRDRDGDTRRKIKQPLLVDLHTNQDHILEYIRRNSTAFVKETASIGKGKDPSVPQGGVANGLHIVQPISRQLHIVEAGSGCTQKVLIGDEVSSMVQVDDIHGTNRLDLLVSTGSGNVVTLESPATFHPLNTWSNGQMRGRNSHAHGYSASQGIYVHEVSRQYTDIFGVYVPVTFEIFDNRPGISREPDKRKYTVEIRDGTSSKRALHKQEYTSSGVVSVPCLSFPLPTFKFVSL